MIYHGSPHEGIELLEPRLSEQHNAYVYFTRNKVLATIYCVQIVSPPSNWYPYGFEDGKLKYIEYYPDALEDVYKGKRGYIYSCIEDNKMFNYPEINDVLVSETVVKTESCYEIIDVYEKLLEYEKEGKLIIQRFDTLTSKQKTSINEMILNEITRYNLLCTPENEYSKFIKTRFNTIWNGLTGV